jgi:hypothetical protein
MNMKTTLLTSAFCLSAFAGINAQIDLVPGINYSYNPPNSQNIITSISIDACNNDNGNASAFDVSMYLYDQSTSNYWIIGTTRLNSGLSGNSCININNWDIDIDDTPSIPQGTYRLGIWVDSNTEITETDENNNAGLLSGNIIYNPSSSGVISFDAAKGTGMAPVFPNPVTDKGNVSFSIAKDGNVKLSVLDVTGKVVMLLENNNFAAGTYLYEFSAGSLTAGFYFIRMESEEGVNTKKFIVK